jgi:cellulose synthase/poly-beta-1,6-N-acetylglucosamine synthase-like glycosyltransferase
MIFTIINYIAWYIFVFISIVWILVVLQNKDDSGTESFKKCKKLPTVSVLIPAYNEEETISKTIKSVLNLNYPKNLLEVIVINDCSTDKTREIAEKFSPFGVKVLNNRTRKGKAYCLNRGIKVSKSELVACVDADSVVEKDILLKMVPYFADKKVASVAPGLKVWKKETFLEKVQHAEYILNILLRKSLEFLDSINVTPGVFSVYRKDILEEIGGFEEGNLTEDMEIALRIHEAGYKIKNNPNAVSYTLCPKKWNELFKQRIRWYRGSIENYIKYKHMLFNTKYGNLGVFFLPMNLIAVFSIIVLFMTIAWNSIKNLLDTIWRIYLIKFDIFVLFSDLNIENTLIQLVSTPTLLGVAGLFLGSYILYRAFNISKDEMKNSKIGCIAYLLFFPFVLMLFWMLALIYEVLDVKRTW